MNAPTSMLRKYTDEQLIMGDYEVSTVGEEVHIAVAVAQAAMRAARSDLTKHDERIAAYVAELEEIELQQQQFRIDTISAVTHGKPLPKFPKSKPTDAATALPILRAQRPALLEKIGDAEGKVRRACVRVVEMKYHSAICMFADAAVSLIDSWGEMLGAKALLDAAGVGAHVTALPPVLWTDAFAIPAVGPLDPISPNAWQHFAAGHNISQGDLNRAVTEVRARIEADIGVRLPW